MVLRIVPTDEPTVQDAIDASSPGDSIKILAGTFDGFEVDVENLKIFGCGIDRTIIAGAPAQGSNDGVVVSANRTTLQGFTVQGFADDGTFISSNTNLIKEIETKLNSGDGIFNVGENNLFIKCKTSLNSDGFDSNGTNNCIINCESSQNSNDGYSISDERSKLLFNLAKNNTSDGLDLDEPFTTILQNKFLGNNCGIQIDDDNHNIIGNSVCDNFESGILLDNNADFNAVDSNIVKNNGNDVTGGSGIFVDSSAEDNTIRFNKARNNFEFDIEAIPPADTANTFDGNQCGNSDPPGLCT
ncbi:right-handed parallel beta-helix repeat-containing protein [Bacillus spongiae]|uniref:Right-handed parallel beta-helix repeat-containing protein n=1 Tax=Bacillus spongiae TaxID=2683610 RepID=A0ABU8H8X0_9BACI